MYRALLRHRWKRFTRSRSAGREAMSGLISLLVGAYFAVVLFSAGFIYLTVIEEAAPGWNPVAALNSYLLLAALALLVNRFYLQRSSRGLLTPYLALPVAKGQLARFTMVESLASLLNVVPFFFFLPLLGRISAIHGTTGLIYWMAGIAGLVLLTHYATLLLRALLGKSSQRFFIAVAVGAALVALDLVLGTDLLMHSSTALFGALLAGRIWPLALLAAALAAAVYAAGRVFRKSLRAEAAPAKGGRRRKAARRAARLDTLFPTDATGALLRLDLKLLLRNKRPRQQVLYVAPLLIVFFLPLLVGPEDVDTFDRVFAGLFATGWAAITYGQFVFSWDSPHFDRLLTAPFTLERLLRARLFFLVMLCTLPFLFFAPLVLLFVPRLLALLTAFFLYNAGVTCFLILALGLWNVKPITLDRSSFFNYEGVGIRQFLLAVPIFVLPFLAAGFLPTQAALLTLAGVGAVLLLTLPLWTRRMGRVLRRRRYTMAAGFREGG